ncbi:MAG TPA: hypothetical protein VIJ59_01340, partial [Caulobacteraceae bacterium]
TTARTSIADLSYRALERLAAAIGGEELITDLSQTVHPQLVVRESSALAIGLVETAANREREKRA